MKLTKKISTKSFLVSHILILILGLIFLFGLHYMMNIQYQKSSNLFLNGPVTSKPKSFTLTVNQPSDESLIFESSILVSGKTGPNMEVLISTDTDDLVIKTKSDGSFSQTLNLSEGVNNIKIVSFDITGDSKESDRIVYYSKEKIQ